MLISDSSSDVCSFDLANFDNAFRTVQREEVGIKLEVTPQVNAAGEVKMFIRQEVSSVAGPVSSRNSDLILNKRSFETVLNVDDGEMFAIGGLINDDERRTIERLPLPSDIPSTAECRDGQGWVCTGK